MKVATTIRTCPCGERLVRKKDEAAGRFEKRLYCNCVCRGRYHKAKRGGNFFGYAARAS